MGDIQLPDLTRTGRRKRLVHEDLRLKETFDRFFSKFKNRYSFHSSCAGLSFKDHILNMYYLAQYDLDDVIYRRDFLSSLLDEKKFRKEFNKIFNSMPNKEPYPVYPKDWQNRDRSEMAIRTDINLIKRHLTLPQTLEQMAELPASSEAAKDLREFAKEARALLEDYSKFAKPLYTRLEKNLSNLDNAIICANHCLAELRPYLEDLRKISKIKNQLKYYVNLCVPYEMKIGKKRIPSCKPEFLDPEKGEGRIIKAYNPAYFQYDPEDKNRVTQLNVPNSIVWGPGKRNTFIHGPNSRGKSVYIRTIALNVHLAMAGLRSFADSCKISPVGNIFPCFDLGDSLGEGHFVTGADKIDYMIDNVNIEDIVLLDEAGGGTEPETERTLAKGVSDALINCGITSFNVTHDKGSWSNYVGKNGVKLLRVADLDDNKRKYQVWPGKARSGYGMRLAKQKKIDPNSIKSRLKQRLN